MANRSDRSSDTPPNVQGFKPAKQSGTELADTIRASSPRNDCTNRPDTRLHPTQPPKHQIEPCNAGAIHTGLSWSADLGNTPGESSTDGLVTRHAAAVASRIELGDYGPQAALHTTSDVVLSLLGRVYRRSSGLVKRSTEQRKAALSRGRYGKESISAPPHRPDQALHLALAGRETPRYASPEAPPQIRRGAPMCSGSQTACPGCPRFRHG